MSQERIVAIQALRFLAALAVAVMHAEIFAYWLGRYVGVVMVRTPWASLGNFGVDIFFAISGFVMVLSSARLFGQERARRRFFARRLVRIVPLYWAGLAFMLVWGLRFGPAPDGASMVHALLFLPYASNTAHGRLVPPLEVGWTLNYEMLFYAMFALCLADNARRTVARVSVVCALFVLAGMVVGLPRPWSFWTSPILLEFVGGMMLAVIHQTGLRLPRALRLALLGLGMVTALTPLLLFAHEPIGFERVAFWGCSAVAILAAATLGTDRAQWRFAGFWTFGGDISYALYLVHMPVMIVMQMVWRHFRLPYGAREEAFFVVLAVIMSLVAAVISHLLFEKPLAQWLRSRIAATS